MNCSTSPPRPGFRSLYALVPALVVAAVTAAFAAAPAPAPAPPFPSVVAASTEREPVAPGVERITYRLLTSAGPIVVNALTVDPREPTLRLDTVLAHDTVVSKDEPVSSMAHRTGAIGGINGDYFDIGASGAPVGIVVRNGTLDRTPNARIALTVHRDRSVRFDSYRFAGTATWQTGSVPITGVNEWPPQGGATLLTPAYGGTPAGTGIAILALSGPLRDAVPGARRFAVTAVVTAPPWPGGMRLAFGAAAQALAPLPAVGDALTVAYDTDPPLAGIAAALGGGPELLRAGIAIDDPGSPNYADRERRIPASAAARRADGTLLLVVVDGRHPATSIGVNRAELIALLRALDATDAMLLDGGGSTTLVGRVLGDAQASVLNDPSDGSERPVADGLFVYSDAPQGPPARLVVRPARIVTLPGAHVALRAHVIDANDHGLGEPHGPWQVAAAPDTATIDADGVLHVGAAARTSTLHVTRGGVAADVPLDVVDRVARVVVGPPEANPDPGGSVALNVAAFDARDRPVAVDGLVRWSAHDATIDAHGRLLVGERDAAVTAAVGGASATLTVPVGRHPVLAAFFDETHRGGWRFSTAPANGPGGLAVDDGTLRLSYDFTAGERAAYANAEIPLGGPTALSCAVDGDANGAALRVTIADRYGDRHTVTLARTVDFFGMQRLGVAIPRALAPPLVLRSLSVVGTLAAPPLTVAGTIGIHDCTLTVPGAPPR